VIHSPWPSGAAKEMKQTSTLDLDFAHDVGAPDRYNPRTLNPFSPARHAPNSTSIFHLSVSDPARSRRLRHHVSVTSTRRER
jgi:hypothetical protein